MLLVLTERPVFKKLRRLLVYPFVDAEDSSRGGEVVPISSLPPYINVSAHLPKTASLGFRELIDVYRETPIEFPHLKAITAAQWAKESGWGTSGLAKDHNNYAGAKWRAGMEAFGRPVTYNAWDGRDTYFHHPDERSFIEAYWKRFDVVPGYKDWRRHAHSPEAFINYIGPIWLGMGAAAGARYIDDVNRICNLRTRYIFT